MTRDQIVTLVTGTVGQTDAASVSLCNSYVQQAYEMVWNAELWRDSVTIDTSASVAQGTNTFNLPSGYDRIVSIQLLSGGVPVGFLDPTTSTFILQTEPTALTSQGVPTKYEEFVHTDGTKKVRLFPVPNAAYTLTISGKRTCPTLGASDSLQIRNVDNAVVSLAIADMWTRLRQLGKAAEMAKKAGAYLDEARNIEKTQSNLPRTAKQLTVAGNSLAEMADAVSARTGQYSPEALIIIKDFLRRNFQQVYDSTLWTESTVEIDWTSVTGVLVLPEFVDRIISIRGTSTLGQLSAEQPSLFYGINPWIFEQTGDPLSFSYLSPVAVPTLPTSAERLSLVSTSANDKTPVFVYGEAVGHTSEIRESVTLNGTTPVLTSNAILVPLVVSKGITTGTVTITGNTSSTQFGFLLPNERERKHIRIQFRPTPTANVTCKILCKRRVTPFYQDEDTPLLRDIGNVLINLATADMFSKMGNDKGSADARAKANENLQTLIDLERSQGANSWQVIPDVEPSMSDWIDSDWIVAK
jgi:hypothetical protein